MTDDEKLELWRNSAVRRAGWVPVGVRHMVDPPGEVTGALRAAIVISAAGGMLGLEYRWAVDSSGTLAADFQTASAP